MKPIQLTAIIALALAPLASAQDGLREKIRELENKAAAAQAEGRTDEAEKLRKAISELAERAKAERVRAEAEKRELTERVKAEAEKREFAEREKAGAEKREGARGEKPLREEISAKIEKVRREGGEKREAAARFDKSEHGDAKRRLEHLSEAIDHLRAAGMREAAESLSEQARVLKQQLTQQSGRGDAPALNVDRQFAEIREGMMNLQRQMQEMQKRLEELSRERK